MPLPNSYEDYLNALSCKQRSYAKRILKKICKDYRVELEDCSNPNACSEGMQKMVDLHQKRWRKVNKSGLLGNPAVLAFHNDLACSLAENGMLGLFLLKINGQAVAASYGYKYNGKYCGYLQGYDPDYSSYSVGSVMLTCLVERLIQEGATEFDLMRGDESYKKQWNAVPRWNYQAIRINNRFVSKFKNVYYANVWCKMGVVKNSISGH